MQNQMLCDIASFTFSLAAQRAEAGCSGSKLVDIPPDSVPCPALTSAVKQSANNL